MKRGSEWSRWDLHVHTASSYDHKYKGEDSDKILVDAWRKENISLVAITDHFIIDAKRILRLREMAPEIKILPGVELRCDKGTSNLHIIIIFSDDNIEKLATNFEVIMRDTKAKSKKSEETIYWDFNDIIEYARNNNGVITIHAGKKDKGMDDGITNKLSANIAIKEEIADNIDIFEMSRIEDLELYNKHVFSRIKDKPMIICSDNHDPRSYLIKENLWVKAELSFNGLVQAIKEPKLRFFVGEIPPKLKIIRDNREKFIDSIEIKGVEEKDNWFNQKIYLNSDLVTIIGNKGNGKSALADIIGHAGNTKNDKYFSFLSENRFNSKNNRLGLKYESCIKWNNGYEEQKKLYPLDNSNFIEKVKYLPQQYMESVCNDLENGFGNELERIIFDYLPTEECLGTNSLQELLGLLTKGLNEEKYEYYSKLEILNNKICSLQKSVEPVNLMRIESNIEQKAKELNLHIEKKPKILIKPEKNEEQQNEINKININIDKLKNLIEIKNERLLNLNKQVHVINETIANIDKTKKSFETWLEKINIGLKEANINESVIANLLINYERIEILKKNIIEEINDIKKDIGNLNDDGKDGILVKQLNQEKEKLKGIMGNLSKIDLEYQRSLQENIEWKQKVDSITKELEKEKEKQRILIEDTPKRLEQLIMERKELVKSIYTCQEKIVNIYKEKYLNVNETINNVEIVDLEKPKIEINFKIDIELMAQNLFNHINHNVKSIFMGKEQAKIKLTEKIEDIKSLNFESIYKILNEIENELKDSSDKVFKNKNEFLNELYALKYMRIEYNLKLGNKILSELSPGERGLVLLIFYLVLDKEQLPLIIDQPEDNLDNQSIYNKLVPYIIMAKERRQIIIVTHNPNIAIACDSEQIIYSKMNKTEMSIEYKSGGIEEKSINKCIIDVLEGTLPAFYKRKERYKL